MFDSGSVNLILVCPSKLIFKMLFLDKFGGGRIAV